MFCKKKIVSVIVPDLRNVAGKDIFFEGVAI